MEKEPRAPKLAVPRRRPGRPSKYDFYIDRPGAQPETEPFIYSSPPEPETDFEAEKKMWAQQLREDLKLKKAPKPAPECPPLSVLPYASKSVAGRGSEHDSIRASVTGSGPFPSHM